MQPRAVGPDALGELGELERARSGSRATPDDDLARPVRGRTRHCRPTQRSSALPLPTASVYVARSNRSAALARLSGKLFCGFPNYLKSRHAMQLFHDEPTLPAPYYFVPHCPSCTSEP